MDASIIDAARVRFARAVREAAADGGELGPVECVLCEDGRHAQALADVGGEVVATTFEFPADAWDGGMCTFLEKLFKGSAEIALRDRR